MLSELLMPLPIPGDISLFITLFHANQVDQFDGREKSHALAVNSDGFNAQTAGQVRFPHTTAADEDHIVRRLGEFQLMQV